MRNLSRIIVVIVLGILVSYSPSIFAAMTIPGSNILQQPSIPISTTPGDANSVILSLGFKILGFLKIFISGIALIYLVLIGVYMIIFSENEERIKSQKKQVIYSLMGFLFLNIPGVIYTVFLPSDKGGGMLDITSNWASTTGGSIVWDTYGFEGAFGQIIAFFRVFIFGAAVMLFTWGLFRIIVSGGNEETQKQGKNRIIYGTLALLFLGFIEGWSVLVANGDFAEYIPYIGSKLFGIAIFFAAPVAVFFLIWGSYYYITSAGDEERIKKGKSIVVNTFIATLILIASLSFLTDLINFKL